MREFRLVVTIDDTIKTRDEVADVIALVEERLRSGEWEGRWPESINHSVATWAVRG